MQDCLTGSAWHHRHRGMLQILRFNWPSYLAAGMVTLTILVFLTAFGRRIPDWAAVMMGSGAILVAYWSLTSLIVSHWVYDRFDIFNLNWLDRCGIGSPKAMVNIHAGLDETSQSVLQRYPQAKLTILDIYDPRTMTEGSISRAREASEPGTAVSADPERLPVAGQEADTVLLIFAAHEIRDRDQREQFFGELHRVLARDGKTVVVEHLRDVANLLAFGPGFLHFLSRREWLRLARWAGLEVSEEFRLTPFVRVLVLTKPGMRYQIEQHLN